MDNNNYPNYFLAGDTASQKSQNWYIRLFGLDLLLMIFSAFLSAYNYETEDSKTIVYSVSGIFLLGALMISIFLKVKKYEDIWYRGRALAESCKTLTWRFIMCSEYFENILSVEEAEKRFIQRIKEISKEFTDLNDVLDSKQLNTDVITTEMKRIRSFSLGDKKAYYINNRIQNQIIWYSSKAEDSKLKYDIWFVVIIFLQFLALISIVFLVKYPSSSYNFVGLFSTVAASGFSWLQVKKYQENKEAYTTANSELNLIKAQGNRDFSDSEFSKYVLDSENAMSREHTLWLAQKRM
ncbi:frataxin-like iron-binding protein CyaY [Flavobacterium nitrogenifigens]|uniref:Frataxin-like iron-binding protein CyaY n=2 Tax=Flavobacterium TaxID=237 RepID=A0A7W7NA69_9FLAO|nr:MULTISPECIES: DUF4231 domain-containing protein [Flavobacterium]MBB4804182.1 frataxin-like iron-binding protein CyaY [Flavobacterium nitrogenifigens]MBB6389141.1 frataxin-like iron-binding protein CyaY [Flavobacterium notoginsengisoli]